MRKVVGVIAMAFTAASLVTGFAIAREVKFEANIDKARIAIGDSAQLGLTFYETQSAPAPDLGNIDGLEIRYIGPSTMMTVINGRVSSSVTHMYKVLPLKTGKFQLGPFTFIYKGDTYTSNMLFLEVGEERVEEEKRAEDMIGEKLDLENRVFLTLDIGKVGAYVSELVPVTVKLYVNRMNLNDIQLPTFDQEGFSKAEFKEPKQYREELGGLVYDVLEFKTRIFGTRAGDYRLGPAKIKANVVVKKRLRKRPSSMDEADEYFDDSFFEDFFTRYERYPIELKSQDLHLVVSPLPSAGRPGDFSGAVGDYQFIYNFNPKEAKVGDPITLTMEINGTGNFNTVLIPKLDSLEAFKVYEPQVKTEENRKTFTQVLIPEQEGVLQIPKATFNYFDSKKGEYRTISHGPLPIKIEKGKEEAPPQVVGSLPVQLGREEEEPRRDIVYIKESAGRLIKKGSRLYKNRAFIIAFPLPAICLMIFYLIHARNMRLRRDTVYAGRVNAYRLAKNAFRRLRHQRRSGDSKLFYETVFKTMQDYLGGRFGVPPAGITFDAVERILRSKDIEEAKITALKRLFEICDRIRFASFSDIDETRMKDDVKTLEELVNYLERTKL